MLSAEKKQISNVVQIQIRSIKTVGTEDDNWGLDNRFSGFVPQ